MAATDQPDGGRVRLADANVLIALSVADHLHHQVARSWFDAWNGALATCPITQGALVRLLVREGVDTATIGAMLTTITDAAWHRFWPDDLNYDESMLRGVIGHRQVTHAYLVALAASQETKLVTLDRGLAALHGDDRVELIET